MAILITGASGFIGNQIAKKLASLDHKVIGIDLNERSIESKNYQFYKFDIRDPNIEEIFKKYDVEAVIHLACIVTPRPGMSREFMYSVDIDGTQNILNLVKKYNTKTLSVASSGAAYGYHASNPEWLKESDPVNGNREFPYSHHKALVENMLLTFKTSCPNVRLFVFRIGTVLGEKVNNQITDLFKKPFLIGIKGAESPFVFIWDEDLIEIFLKSINSQSKPGVYNIAGNGRVTISEIAEELRKKVIYFPAVFLKSLLFILKRLKLTQYGEEQINFLRYRPVLDNNKLVKEFSYKPKYSSLEAFKKFITSQQIE